MTPFDSTQGSQAAYDFWLGLIPQFLGQFGGLPGTAAAAAAGAGGAVPEGLKFPLDQIAKAAAMTEQTLQALGQALAPMLQAGGAQNLLAQWATAAPHPAFGKPDGTAATATAATQAMLAPWAALMSNVAGAMSMATAQGSGAPAPAGAAAAQSPLQAMSQAWIDMASRMAGATPAQADSVFDRTYGALSDALGLGPQRKLHAAWRELAGASVAQQDARLNYSTLVQSAFAQGFQRLLAALAEKANAGERIDSVLALLRLWAVNTEQAVHETLQSERGLAATAALIRADLAYRKKMQHVAAVFADLFDMASRRELDDAYREIQALKRELRGLRAERSADDIARKPAPRRKTAAAKSKRGEKTRVESDPAQE